MTCLMKISFELINIRPLYVVGGVWWRQCVPPKVYALHAWPLVWQCLGIGASQMWGLMEVIR